MSESLPLIAFISILGFSILQAAQAIECFSCRGINCQRTTIQNKTEICQDNLDSCVTIFDKFTVTAKGCLMNIPVELRRKCDQQSNPECQVCTGGLCNNKGRIDFKCFQCDERDKDGSKCASKLSSLSPIQCSVPTAPNSYCFTRSYKGSTVRGCSLDVKDQRDCLADVACTLCLAEYGEGCNSREMTASGGSSICSSYVLVLLLPAAITRVFF